MLFADFKKANNHVWRRSTVNILNEFGVLKKPVTLIKDICEWEVLNEVCNTAHLSGIFQIHDTIKQDNASYTKFLP